MGPTMRRVARGRRHMVLGVGKLGNTVRLCLWYRWVVVEAVRVWTVVVVKIRNIFRSFTPTLLESS